MSEKAALRRQLRSLYGGAQVRAEESRLICRHILESDWYREAQIVAGYVPLKWEADVTAVLQHALESGRTLALPLCAEAPRMTLRLVASLEALVPGRYGIPEPREDTEIIDVEAVHLLLIPLEGVDPGGMRLGKGGGYYDCLLADRSVRSVGCALSWQKADRIPNDPWDRPLAACADREGMHIFRNMSK